MDAILVAMRQVKNAVCYLTISILCAGCATAQRAWGIFNDAGFSPYVDEPALAIAPGSLFQLFGLSLGPKTPVRAASIPLPTALAGVSVRITAGSTTIDAPILSAESARIEAQLPANTPLGDAQLVVTSNGYEGPPLDFQVIRRSFAFYSAVQNRLPDGSWIPNTANHAARPGGLVSLWGTGLGAGAGSDTYANLDPSPGLEVLVGGKPARVVYAGDWSGVDLIVIEVPPVIGCNVWAKLRYPDGPGEDAPKTNSLNSVSFSISQESEACAGPFDPPPQIMDRIRAQYGLRMAVLGGSIEGFSLSVGHGILPLAPAPGTCGLWEGAIGIPTLNAGATVSVHGPKGASSSFSFVPTDFGGRYAGPPQWPPVEPGEYTLENGKGGTDVGAFSTSFTVPDSPFTWTNPDTRDIQRDSDLHITWNGGDPKAGYVVVGILFAAGPPDSWFTQVGGTSCIARADQGTMTIPASDLWTTLTRSARRVLISVSYYAPHFFEAPGIDAGAVFFAASSVRTLEIR